MQAYLPLRKTCLKSKQDILQTERIFIMPEYKKVGYLTTDFKMFHLKDEEMRTFHYHYHDFHKILILLNGDVTYCIEGRSYDLKKNDIVLVPLAPSRPLRRTTHLCFPAAPPPPKADREVTA